MKRKLVFVTVIALTSIQIGCFKREIEAIPPYDEEFSYQILSESYAPASLTAEVSVYKELGVKRSRYLNSSDMLQLKKFAHITDPTKIRELVDLLRSKDIRPPNTTPQRNVPIAYHLIFSNDSNNKLGYLKILNYRKHTFLKPWSATNSYQYYLTLAADIELLLNSGNQ